MVYRIKSLKRCRVLAEKESPPRFLRKKFATSFRTCRATGGDLHPYPLFSRAVHDLSTPGWQKAHARGERCITLPRVVVLRYPVSRGRHTSPAYVECMVDEHVTGTSSASWALVQGI